MNSTAYDNAMMISPTAGTAGSNALETALNAVGYIRMSFIFSRTGS